MSADTFLWFILWLAAGLGGYIVFFWRHRFVEPTETPPSVLFRIVALVAIISGPILLMVALLTRSNILKNNIARGLLTMILSSFFIFGELYRLFTNGFIITVSIYLIPVPLVLVSVATLVLGVYWLWNGLRGAKVEPRPSPKPSHVREESPEPDTPLKPTRTNYLTIASLVLGIVSTLLWVGAFLIFFNDILCFSVLGFPLGAAAFITGLIGYLQVKKSDGAQRGTRIAIVGMSLAAPQLALGCLLLALLAFMLSVYGVL